MSDTVVHVTAPYPNPVLTGFNPDPSVVAVDGVYYIVTSTFEYLPGLPVYRSTDFATWQLIGNVATRPEQIEVENVQSNLGVWAPTIRYRDGVFYVIVSIAGSRGCVVFTATDPAGPWSDGLAIPGVGGIDPDLAWDEHGTAFVTYSGLILSGPETGKHLGIQQVRVDLTTGETLEEPRSLWSGSGFMFPEAPHLYERDGFWYLMIAEGGTERGHGVSIARSTSPSGPFEAGPANPFLTARSTIRPIQNTGHGDLVEGPDGETLMVLLGVRPGGGTRAFSPLGRETFVTRVAWVDGWPVAEPVQLATRGSYVEEVDFGGLPGGLLGPEWIGIRRLPGTVSEIDADARALRVTATGDTLSGASPAFVGRRQKAVRSQCSVVVDVSEGDGGLAVRYDEETFVSVAASIVDGVTRVVATIAVPSIRQQWTADLPVGPVTLHLDTTPSPTAEFSSEAMSSDHITLSATAADETVVLARVDGRSLSAETAASFTGRVLGLYADRGTVAFSSYRFDGTD